MLANHRQNRENASRTSHGSRRYSARTSERSKGSRYKEKAYEYYNTFGGKTKQTRALSSHGEVPMTPPNRKESSGSSKYHANYYIKHSKADEGLLQSKSKGYLAKQGIDQNKANRRYYRDNDIANHLKINKKQ